VKNGFDSAIVTKIPRIKKKKGLGCRQTTKCGAKRQAHTLFQDHVTTRASTGRPFRFPLSPSALKGTYFGFSTSMLKMDLFRSVLQDEAASGSPRLNGLAGISQHPQLAGRRDYHENYTLRHPCEHKAVRISVRKTSFEPHLRSGGLAWCWQQRLYHLHHLFASTTKTLHTFFLCIQ
jgi:hypothetical protein